MMLLMNIMEAQTVAPKSCTQRTHRRALSMPVAHHSDSRIYQVHTWFSLQISLKRCPRRNEPTRFREEPASGRAEAM